MTEIIKEIFRTVGINEVGFCDFDAVKNHLISCRAMTRIPDNAKSIIICAFPYKVCDEPPEKLSRYAAVPDYHEVCRNYLQKAADILNERFKEDKFEIFIDNSPIPEVYTAARAELGVIGKNGLLITEKYGSFVFLGEIVTTLALEGGKEVKTCVDCGKCKAVCPVNLDKSRCLSALSQKKGELSAKEAQELKENSILWGCDICAENCPMNRNAQNTDFAEFIDGYRSCYSPDENPDGRPYNWRGKEVIRRNRKIYKNP